MQWKTKKSACGPDQLIIIQEQGENVPTIMYLPYDITGFDFNGTVNFPTPLLLSIGSGLTINDSVSFTGSISNNTLTVTALLAGALYVGMPILSEGTIPGTTIVEFGTGSGGVGTYTISAPQVVPSQIFSTGIFQMQLTSAQTQDIPEGQYEFDLWSTDTGNVNTAILRGFFEINTALTVIS